MAARSASWRLRFEADDLGRHKTAADSLDQRSMLSIAHVWSWLIHVPFLGGALALLILWKLAAGWFPRPKGRR